MDEDEPDEDAALLEDAQVAFDNAVEELRADRTLDATTQSFILRVALEVATRCIRQRQVLNVYAKPITITITQVAEPPPEE